MLIIYFRPFKSTLPDTIYFFYSTMFKKFKKAKILLFFILLKSFFLPFVSFAALVPCGPGTSKPNCQLCDLFVMFKNIVNFIIFDIVPPLAALIIAIGGFIWIFSMGEPDKIERAKKLFLAVGLGLLIIYGAWAIINTFFWALGVTVWEGWGNWWTIPC